ncbi:MAG: dihydrolipoyl dehydrogenase [Candidatus Omnitrophica bacterium]|nr:dihydrolipoyl dehydrogenase [Candidatus Omnitrophota bacterium]
MYDLAVIGAGWAGFNAALKAKELGLKVCLIESGRIGGTCLNFGCIPTKALIVCAKIFQLAKKAPGFGVELDNPRFNFTKIQERKNKIVRELAQGMRGRLAGIDLIESVARISSPNEIKADGRLINSKFILISTGSHSVLLPGLKIDQEKIILSDQALALSEIPQSLLIIGGGVIGCEFASLFSILGSKVAIIEKMPFLLPGEDMDIARKIEVIFKKKGIQVTCGADIANFNLEDYSRILVCVGRTANTAGLGLENLGVELANNRIIVDDYLQSSVAGIYAAGDCASKIMLAHYAAYQGRAAVENMVSNNKHKADNKIVPACIFTEPQIASVGLNEENALAAGLSVKVHKFDFRANAMARIIDEAEGFIKIISNRQTQEVIGASIIGPLASELISILSMAISAHLTVDQIRAMILAHPTLSESIYEAV